MSRGGYGGGKNFKITSNRDGDRSFNNSRGRGYRGRGGKGRGYGGGDHDDRDYQDYSSGGGPQRRGRGRGGYRGKVRFKGSGGYNRNTGPNPRSRLEDDDGDVSMGDNEGPSTSASRFNPYGDRPPTRRGYKGNAAMDSQQKGAMQRLGLPVGGRYSDRSNSNRGRDRGGGNSNSGWFKVSIPYGKKHGKDFILKSINNLCDVPFVPVQYHHESGMAVFYVNDKTTADAVRNTTRRVTLPNGFKMIVLVRSCPAPQTNELDESQVEKLKVTMSNRYDPATKALDLSNLYQEPTLTAEGIQVAINRPSIMGQIITIIEQNIPEIESLSMSKSHLRSLDAFSEIVGKTPNLKKLDLGNNQIRHENELECIKNLKIEDLVLDGNPMCDYYKDQTAYVSAIRKIFPKVIRLDGNELPPPITFDIESPTQLPERQKTFFMDESVKSLLGKFLEQYFLIYDSDSRQPLLEAYHDSAMFSYSTGTNKTLASQFPKLSEYIPESRNLLRVKDSGKRQRTLKQGKLNVVAALCQLPKTQHDLNTMTVDVSVATSSLLVFSITGVFKERESKSDHPPIRYFSRTFVTVPQGAGIVITNDEIVITNASPEQIAASFKHPAPTPSPSPIPGASPQGSPAPINQEQQKEMVKQFSLQSGMNEEWSAKCLLQNDWDYEKSARVFTDLQSKGGIPPEAFIK